MRMRACLIACAPPPCALTPCIMHVQSCMCMCMCFQSACPLPAVLAVTRRGGAHAVRQRAWQRCCLRLRCNRGGFLRHGHESSLVVLLTPGAAAPSRPPECTTKMMMTVPVPACQRCPCSSFTHACPNVGVKGGRHAIRAARHVFEAELPVQALQHLRFPLHPHGNLYLTHRGCGPRGGRGLLVKAGRAPRRRQQG